MTRRRFGSPQSLALLIVLAVLATFARGVVAEFLTWDDWYNIWQNPRLNPPTWAGVGHYWSHAAYGLYIPITYTVWGAVAAIGYVYQADPSGSHLNPYLFHAANVVVHVLATLGVYRILLTLRFAAPAACIGALLFGLHPVQVEPVAWTAGLKDVLAGALGLAALLMYLHAAERPSARTYAIATLTLILAMLSKPSALVVPAMAVALDWLWLRRPWRSVLRAGGPWSILMIACAIVGRIVQPATGVTPAPLWQRPMVMADTFAFYLGKIVWPARLAIDYGRTPQLLLASGALRWTWMIVLIVAAVLALARDRRISVGVMVLALGIAPTSGMVPFLYQYYSTVADHYLYLPMLGAALVAAQLMMRLGSRAMPVAIGLLLMLATRSVFQLGYWHDDLAAFVHATQITPRSFMAWNNAGSAYLNLDQFEQSEHCFREALQIKPDYVSALQNLANLLAAEKHYPEAIQQHEAALKAILSFPPMLRSSTLPDLNGLVDAFIAVGRIDSALRYQQLAEAAAPNDAAVQAHRSQLKAIAATRPAS